jgi:TRAP transporter TAXI family solute receptor
MPRQTVAMATGAAGGAFAEYGPGIAKVVAAHARIDLEQKPTAGSNDNVRLVNDASVPLGLVNMGPAYEAWTGTEAWRGQKLSNLRALLPMYETPFHIVALGSSGIRTLRDLAGKRVGVGPAKGPAENFFRALTDSLGIRTTLVNGSPSDNAAQLVAGTIDAFWYGAGLPIGAFREVADRAPATVFGLTPEEIAVFRQRFPYLAEYPVPAGTYRGQAAQVNTVAVWNFVLAHKDVPEATVYDIVKALLDHPAEVARAYPAASATVTRNAAANTFLPFHPGAVRYYRERGLTLRAELTP